MRNQVTEFEPARLSRAFASLFDANTMDIAGSGISIQPVEHRMQPKRRKRIDSGSCRSDHEYC